MGILSSKIAASKVSKYANSYSPGADAFLLRNLAMTLAFNSFTAYDKVFLTSSWVRCLKGFYMTTGV